MQFLEAIEVALDLESEAGNWEQRKEARCASIWVDLAMPKYGGIRQVAQLRSLEDEALGAYHEAPGAVAALFWAEMARRGLPYSKRHNILDTITEQDKLANRREYNCVIDFYNDLVEAGQDPEQLNRWIMDFEDRSSPVWGTERAKTRVDQAQPGGIPARPHSYAMEKTE